MRINMTSVLYLFTENVDDDDMINKKKLPANESFLMFNRKQQW